VDDVLAMPERLVALVEGVTLPRADIVLVRGLVDRARSWREHRMAVPDRDSDGAMKCL
jgi:hypothetical protein